MFDFNTGENGLVTQVTTLIGDETNLLANFSNFSSLIYHSISDLIWSGFYLYYPKETSELILGPFCGKPACIRIKPGKGVCGTAFSQGSTINVPDVEKFPGHIYCDPETKSELVIPLIYNGRTIGVFDLDSKIHNRFEDKELINQLEKSVAILLNRTEINLPQLI